MSLNVSREMLQQNRQTNAIRRRLPKKVLSTIKDAQAERPEDYRRLWTQFGRVIKEGLVSDFANQDAVVGIGFDRLYAQRRAAHCAG
jgi:molecular chaperone HtpG